MAGVSALPCPVMAIRNEFSDALGLIDLRGSLAPASERNDLLPPRPDDNVGGNVGRRFLDRLIRAVDQGRYAPVPAAFVSVPKPGFTSRPAAVLMLEDRCLYYALVESLGERIEQVLPGRGALLWPRAIPSEKRWHEFEHGPYSVGTSHIVRADIAGFYESIPHEELADRLLASTGRGEIVAALASLLTRVMGRPKGLPQGLATSDVLATVYLAPVDWAMLRSGWAYVRHGDDIRIPVDSYAEGRRAIQELEEELRGVGLMLNASKSYVLRRDTYEGQAMDVQAAVEEWRGRLRELIVGSVIDQGEGAIEEAFAELGLDDEVLWDAFYRGTADLQQVEAVLRDNVEPDSIDVAIRLLEETIDRAPGHRPPGQRTASERHANGLLSKEAFHGRLSSSLTVLAAGKSEAAIASASWVVGRFPDEVELVAQYLASAVGIDPSGVAAEIEKLLTSKLYVPGWTKAWLLQSVQALAPADRVSLVPVVSEIASHEAEEWVARSEAVHLLGRWNELDHETAHRALQRAPAPYRVHILAGASQVQAQWAEAFVGGAGLDRVQDLVVERSKP